MSVCVSFPSIVTQRLIEQCLQERGIQLANSVQDSLNVHTYWCDYDRLPYEKIHTGQVLASSYLQRKALTRKHHLLSIVEYYMAKHPSIASFTPPSWSFEMGYVDEFDELLIDELGPVQALLKCNETLADEDKQYFIFKPGLHDGGDGLELFASVFDLQAIILRQEEGQGRRNYVIQEYIQPSLLTLPSGSFKCHFRVYTVAVGALSIFVHRQILVLCAGSTYVQPGVDLNLNRHITNTCRGRGKVLHFWDLQGLELGGVKMDLVGLQDIYKEIKQVIAHTFQAALDNGPVHFQLLPNVFEIFGFDIMLDQTGRAVLLEVNAGPDFEQTGPDQMTAVQDLFRSVSEHVIETWTPQTASSIASKPRDASAGAWSCVAGTCLGSLDCVLGRDLQS